MSWDRAACAKALADAIQAVVTEVGDTATVFDKPPYNLNPPSIVVGRPIEVRYGIIASTIDEADLPVACVGPVDGDDRVAELIALVRSVGSSQLGGVVQIAYPATERNWRQVNVAGADMTSADVMFTIQM